MFASIENATRSKDLVLKNWKLKHTNCNYVWKNPTISVKYIAGKYLERMKVIKKIPADSIRQNVDEDFST